MANLVNKFIQKILNDTNHKNCYIFNDIENSSFDYPMLKLEEIKDKINIIQQEDLIFILISDAIKSYDEYFGDFSRLTLLCSENTFVLNYGEESILDSELYKELISLGYNLITKRKDSNSFLCIYAYNISKYKILPDWLNSDNWANPKLWEK